MIMALNSSLCRADPIKSFTGSVTTYGSSPGTHELVAIDPTPALGELEQDIGDAAAKNDWGQDLSTRIKAAGRSLPA